MTDFFLNILNTGISAGWVVLGVIAARFLLRKAPRNLVCWLWVIVAARLLLPATIEAPFSLIPSSQIIQPQSMFDAAPEIHSGVEFIDNAVNPIYSESFAANDFASVNPLQVWTAVAANFWVLGMAAMLLWAAVSYWRLSRQVAAARRLQDNIYLCGNIDTPFILGVLRPRIYLPASLPEAQREPVLAHEKAHLHRRDHWWKPLAYVLLSVFWFHPLLWVGYWLLCRDIELACDEQVIKAMTVREKKDYSTALLECSIHRRAIVACPLAFGEVGVRERIKSVLSYKKPAFWVILVSIILCAVVAVCFLTDPVTRTPEIRYNGVLYIHDGSNTNHIPDEVNHIGNLRSVLHRTDEHPDEEFQATNLDEIYAGCELYLAGETLYLQKTGGGYLPFRLRTPNALIAELSAQPLDVWVSVQTENTVETELLQGDRLLAMEMALESLRYANFLPGAVSADITAPAAIQFDRRGESANGMELALLENGQWVLTVLDPDYGPSVWLLSETMLTEDLENQLARYYTRAEYGSEVYENPQHNESSSPVRIRYQTVTHGGVTMTIGIPYEGSVWDYGELDREPGDESLGIRYRPAGVEIGWVNVCYYPEGYAAVSLPAGDWEQIAFPTGLTATKVTPEEGGAWTAIAFHMEEGTLLAATEDVDSWWPEYGDVATSILGSLTVYDNGRNVLAISNPLGIHLSVRDVTPTGLTLICRQDGTYAEQLHTGAPYSISRFEDGAWISLEPPEGTVWTMVAYSVPTGETSEWPISWNYLYGELPPGRYRISKSYSGKLPDGTTPTALADWTDQVCYAEFIIG